MDPITVIVLVAKSHDDRDEWVTLLRTLCRGNPTTPVAKYHPALYQSGKWNCCGETSKLASGCEPVTWVANRIKTESTSIRSAGNTTAIFNLFAFGKTKSSVCPTGVLSGAEGNARVVDLGHVVFIPCKALVSINLYVTFGTRE